MVRDDDDEVRDMSIPPVEVPDARDVLPRLSREHRARVQQRIEYALSRGVRFAPWTFDYPMDNLRVFLAWHDHSFLVDEESAIERRNPHVKAWLQAAEVDREHGNLCLVVEPFEDVGPSVTWLTPETLGVSRLDWKRWPSFVL
ncbi:MAG TPA: hypothetical protein VGH87_26690 [Polyangiaceae bacterium]|nr:hypothetical protein [Polyangiaceae bacterium]